ncbi:alkaline phosphatase family protein [Nocardioides luti]|nr:alkaline phosphatase family protein [Nocardioides luti]
MVENHSLDQMRTQLPYTFGLAQEHGYATHYAALTHPSLPNYLAIAGGSTFGVTDDDPPVAHPVRGASVFGQALAHGRTATLYAEGMPFGCAREDGGERYGVRHNPWAYFADEQAACEQHDTTLAQLPADVASGDLPNAGMLVPDTCHDAHDCDASVADAWLRTELPLLMSGPDWRAGRLAVVVTADEDDHSQGNLVLTTVLHPSLHGVVVDTPLTHYSLTRLYDEVLGVAPLRAARRAPSMAQAFGLPVAGLR